MTASAVLCVCLIRLGPLEIIMFQLFFITCAAVRRSPPFTSLHCCSWWLLLFFYFFSSFLYVVLQFRRTDFELFMKEIKTCLIFNRKLWIVICISLFMGDEASFKWDDGLVGPADLVSATNNLMSGEWFHSVCVSRGLDYLEREVDLGGERAPRRQC